MNWLEKAKAYDWNFLSVSDTAGTGVKDVANKIIDMVALVAGILAVIYLLYSGIIYITAGGNPDNAKKGQQGVINAIIGIVIIVLAYFIATSIANYSETIA